MVFQYGTNESDLWRLDRDDYEHALADLIDELRDVAGAPLLVVAPLDRAESREGKLVTKQVILDLVAIQRRVAFAHGAAFWDTFDAMGGEGSMARWIKARPQLGGTDLTHPTPLGAEVIGDMLSDAIVGAYEAWVQERRRLRETSRQRTSASHTSAGPPRRRGAPCASRDAQDPVYRSNPVRCSINVSVT